MSWSIGYDSRFERDIGYGVPAICDHPDCNEKIDRGLGCVCCEQQAYGGDNGCGLYFCSKHRDGEGKCERCQKGEDHFEPKPDAPEWVKHKMKHKSWAEWRKENPDFVNQHEKKAWENEVET